MAIEIKPNNTGMPQSVTQKSQQVSAPMGLSDTRTQTDTVTVTSAAEDLIEMEKKLSDIDGIDAAKVADIKQRIQAGDYPMDAAKIAGKLIEQELELL